MEKTERAGLQVKMDVLLQTAEESCLLGSDAWYGKLRDVVYALYEQKEIPLEMLIKAERRLGQLEMDVRLAEHGLTPLPQPAPEQPKQETCGMWRTGWKLLKKAAVRPVWHRCGNTF